MHIRRQGTVAPAIFIPELFMKIDENLLAISREPDGLNFVLFNFAKTQIG